MFEITAILLLIAIAATAADWRQGLFIAVAVGLIQDPLRKVVPGEPVIYVLLIAVVIGVAALAAVVSGKSLMPNRILGWNRYLAAPFIAFIAVLILQAINSFMRYGDVTIAMIGFMSYVTPFFALCLVYQMIVNSSQDFFWNFMRFYVVCVFFVLLTIFLEYSGYDWAVLGEVGPGLIIYDQGTVMSAYSGLFRSSEIAAWHAAASACFLGVLLMSRRMTLSEALAVSVVVLAIVALGMLTGRRKFIVQIIIFVSAYGTLLLYFGRNASRLAMIAGLVGLLGYVGLVFSMPDEKEFGPITYSSSYDLDSYELYVARTQSVFGDLPERFTDLGLAPIGWAYQKFGLLGAGLGSGSQGTQHFGFGAQGAAEGGLGKIWVELGLPGLVVLAWLGMALAVHLWAVLKSISRQSPRLNRMALGLTSMLIANVATFAVATQAYGDFFVLLMMGSVLGALFAMPILTERAARKRMLGFRGEHNGAPASYGA